MSNTSTIYKQLKLIMVGLLAFFMMVACTPTGGSEPAASETQQPEQVTMYVGPQKVECVGLGPQECLQIKFAPEEEWQLYYSNIEGFNYEPGYEYELLVNKIEIIDPAADSPSFQYTLVEEVSKTAVPIDPGAGQATGEAPDLNGTSWVLTGILVGGDAMTTTEFDQEITLNFENGQANGSAGCNSYFATYTQNGDSLTFAGIGQTEMACAETERMERESQFLAELANTGRVSVEGSEMTFWHKDGNYRTLVFTQAGSSGDAVTELGGTSWTLAGILVGGDAMTNSEIDAEITLTFENGQVSGSAGCNGYSAPYTLEGNNLTFGLISSTMMACEDERMNRETEFLTALGNIGSYMLENNQLTLLHKDGNYPVLVFNMADNSMEQANLEDTLWVLNGIVIGGDAVSGTEVDQNINATFNAGQLTGSAGCNGYSASYTLSGESLTISAPVSTKMMCTEELVMEREVEFLGALEKVNSYMIEDNMLTLNDAQGLPLLMFIVGGGSN